MLKSLKQLLISLNFTGSYLRTATTLPHSCVHVQVLEIITDIQNDICIHFLTKKFQSSSANISQLANILFRFTAKSSKTYCEL
jgi:hypothetical protein